VAISVGILFPLRGPASRAGDGVSTNISKTFRNAIGSISPSSTNRNTLQQQYGKLPLSFEPNHGQTDARVKFLSRGRGYALFLTPTEAVLAPQKVGAAGTQHSIAASAARTNAAGGDATSTALLRMELMGANTAPQVTGQQELPGRSNYFIGNDPKKWRTNVPTYARVNYPNVYPGVDLVYYGNQQQLEHALLSGPGPTREPSRWVFQVPTNSSWMPRVTSSLELVTAKSSFRPRLSTRRTEGTSKA